MNTADILLAKTKDQAAIIIELRRQIQKQNVDNASITKQLKKLQLGFEPRIIEGGMTVMGGGKNAKKLV